VSAAPFAYVERVRFGDLDALRHVNNVELLRFFETARIAWFRSTVPEHDPTNPGTLGVILAENHVSYRSPAFLDDEIRTTIRPSDLKRSSVRVNFEMHVEEGRRLLADGYGVLVSYDYEAGATHPFPDAVRDRLAASLIG
jgi:acyl-CoA thioester hydrolase